MLDVRKQYRSYEWDYESNHYETWLGNQLRLFSAPFPNTEAFVKVEADWNPGSNDADRPVYQYRESHLRYRWDQKKYGADTYIFQRQDRFWVENHLIQVVQSGNLNDSGNAQGARFDLWGLGTNLTFIASDFSGQSNPSSGAAAGAPVATDDAYVLRMRRTFFKERLRLGFTLNRRVEAREASGGGEQGVNALDLRYTLGNTDILLEYADAHAKDTPDFVEGSFKLDRFQPDRIRRLDLWLPGDAVVRGEVRALTVGTPSLGYYNIVPTFWYYGSDFVNPLGDANRDEQGVWINTWYLLPQRAVTLSLNYTSWEHHVYEKRHYTEVYAEIYTEYELGFTSKLAFSDRRNRDRLNPEEVTVTENKDLFAEVQVESELAWMRVQTKIKDIGTARRKELASLESTLNLTPTLKLYGRYTFGNDPARLRRGLFAQLQYRPRGNMEVFLEYGPNWIGDSPNPVDDGDLAGSGDNQDLVKFIIKGSF